MGLLLPGYMPRGVVAILTDMDDSPNTGSTETVVYQLPFKAAPKRIYKVCFRVGRADTNGTGDQTDRGAKSSAAVRCRWTSGSTAKTSGTSLGDYRVTVFNNDSNTATGVDASWYLINPPAGQVAVGISLWNARPATTDPVADFGLVRLLADGHAHLVVEDVGPYSE